MGNEDNSKQELQDGQPQIMDGQDDSHVASLSTPMVAEGAHAAPGTAEKNGIIPLSVTSGEASLLELVGRLASGGRCSESEAAALVYTTAAVLAQHSQRHTEEQLQHHIEETSQQESQENAQQDAAQHAPQRIQRNSQQGFGSPLFVPLRHAQAPGTASGLVSAVRSLMCDIGDEFFVPPEHATVTSANTRTSTSTATPNGEGSWKGGEAAEAGAVAGAGDVWALGSLLYFALSGRTLWDPLSASCQLELDLVQQEGMMDLFSHPWPLVSVEARHLLARMLQRDPARRPSAAQVLDHPWLLPHRTSVSQHQPLGALSQAIPGHISTGHVNAGPQAVGLSNGVLEGDRGSVYPGDTGAGEETRLSRSPRGERSKGSHDSGASSAAGAARPAPGSAGADDVAAPDWSHAVERGAKEELEEWERAGQGVGEGEERGTGQRRLGKVRSEGEGGEGGITPPGTLSPVPPVGNPHTPPVTGTHLAPTAHAHTLSNSHSHSPRTPPSGVTDLPLPLPPGSHEANDASAGEEERVGSEGRDGGGGGEDKGGRGGGKGARRGRDKGLTVTFGTPQAALSTGGLEQEAAREAPHSEPEPKSELQALRAKRRQERAASVRFATLPARGYTKGAPAGDDASEAGPAQSSVQGGGEGDGSGGGGRTGERLGRGYNENHSSSSGSNSKQWKRIRDLFPLEPKQGPEDRYRGPESGRETQASTDGARGLSANSGNSGEGEGEGERGSRGQAAMSRMDSKPRHRKLSELWGKDDRGRGKSLGGDFLGLGLGLGFEGQDRERDREKGRGHEGRGKSMGGDEGGERTEEYGSGSGSGGGWGSGSSGTSVAVLGGGTGENERGENVKGGRGGMLRQTASGEGPKGAGGTPESGVREFEKRVLKRITSATGVESRLWRSKSNKSVAASQGFGKEGSQEASDKEGETPRKKGEASPFLSKEASPSLKDRDRPGWNTISHAHSPFSVQKARGEGWGLSGKEAHPGLDPGSGVPRSRKAGLGSSVAPEKQDMANTSTPRGRIQVFGTLRGLGFMKRSNSESRHSGSERRDRAGAGEGEEEISSDYAAALALASRRVERELLNAVRPGRRPIPTTKFSDDEPKSDTRGDAAAGPGASTPLHSHGVTVPSELGSDAITVSGVQPKREESVEGIPLPGPGLGLVPDDREGVGENSTEENSIEVEELVPFVEVGDKQVDNLLEGFSAILIKEQDEAAKGGARPPYRGANGGATASIGTVTGTGTGEEGMKGPYGDGGVTEDTGKQARQQQENGDQQQEGGQGGGGLQQEWGGGGEGAEEEEEEERQSMVVDGMGRRLLQGPMAHPHPRRKHGRSSHVFC